MKTLTLVTALSLAATLPAQQVPTHAPDGGTRQHLDSIVIPSSANAPFSAVVVTEWTRILVDGGTIVIRNHRTVARDSTGRVFQERRFFSANGDKQLTALSELDYEDPNRHELTICRPEVLICTVYQHDAPAIAPLPNSGPLPNGMGSITREDLGPRVVENLNVLGSREITTFNPGTIGNDKPEPVVKEFWYSPDLGINLITKRFDPRVSSAQNFDVTAIHLTEPDPRLFVLPADYHVIRAENR